MHCSDCSGRCTSSTVILSENMLCFGGVSFDWPNPVLHISRYQNQVFGRKLFPVTGVRTVTYIVLPWTTCTWGLFKCWSASQRWYRIFLPRETCCGAASTTPILDREGDGAALISPVLTSPVIFSESMLSVIVYFNNKTKWKQIDSGTQRVVKRRVKTREPKQRLQTAKYTYQACRIA